MGVLDVEMRDRANRLAAALGVLVHSAPPFCFAGRTIPPAGAQYELFRFRCMLEKQRKWNLA